MLLTLQNAPLWDEGRPLATLSLGRLLRGLAERWTCSRSTVPSKKIKSFLLLKSNVASYLTKCTIVACRNGIVVWKIHVFALSEKGPVYFFKGHPTLKRGIAIKNGLLSHTATLKVATILVAMAPKILELAT